jgi:hypothetical protein
MFVPNMLPWVKERDLFTGFGINAALFIGFGEIARGASQGTVRGRIATTGDLGHDMFQVETVTANVLRRMAVFTASLCLVFHPTAQGGGRYRAAAGHALTSILGSWLALLS